VVEQGAEEQERHSSCPNQTNGMPPQPAHNACAGSELGYRDRLILTPEPPKIIG
jgi:hypothetical protein